MIFINLNLIMIYFLMRSLLYEVKIRMVVGYSYKEVWDFYKP